MPAKNIVNKRLSPEEMFAFLKRTKPISRLNKAHAIFTTGDESPLPDGFANGVGKGFPQMPVTKCGTKLVRKSPAKNALT